MGEDALRNQAIETGFCIRKSKLSPEVFFDLLFFASSRSQNSSLEHLVSHLDSSHGIDIHKQSLDERFTEKTVRFVKSVLSRLIQAQSVLEATQSMEATKVSIGNRSESATESYVRRKRPRAGKLRGILEDVSGSLTNIVVQRNGRIRILNRI